ncbi:XkdX family protein [Halalkalibacterium halodurans]|nr:XkdX family protein [Halalkalibacterium halodurans]
MSPMFETLKERFLKNWCRKDQLKQFVQLGAITADEYKEITGEDFK